MLFDHEQAYIIPDTIFTLDINRYSVPQWKDNAYVIKYHAHQKISSRCVPPDKSSTETEAT